MQGYRLYMLLNAPNLLCLRRVLVTTGGLGERVDADTLLTLSKMDSFQTNEQRRRLEMDLVLLDRMHLDQYHVDSLP